MTDASTITVRVPLKIRRRPGRKTVVTPVRKGAAAELPTRADPALVKALARAFRYQKLLDEGRYASISEMANAERIERGFLGKLLRLTLLAPTILEELVNGHARAGLTLPRLLEPVPITWAAQQHLLRGVEGGAGNDPGSGSSQAREE